MVFPDASGLTLACYHTYISRRVIMVQEYWESFDKLLAYPHDRSGRHFPAWAAFNRAIGMMGTAGGNGEKRSPSR
jgi:Domain of unknown function (DUF4188)